MSKGVKMRSRFLVSLILSISILSGCGAVADKSNLTSDFTTINVSDKEQSNVVETVKVTDNTDYLGVPYNIVNNNKPYFTEEDKTTDCFEIYSELDDLGRCGVAYACLSTETQPPKGEKRGAIGNVRPSGWHTVKYPEYIKDLYLYNRCHLIGWQLGNENANNLNLITGTRYLNIEGMLPFENKVDDYIAETGNHVLYRVTPRFTDDNLIADGVLMEAQSVEDDNCVFCVWCPNIQPNIIIDYSTGDSWVGTKPPTQTETQSITVSSNINEYVLNIKTKKVHLSDCRYVDDMNDSNKEVIEGSLQEILDEGFDACKVCNPEGV